MVKSDFSSTEGITLTYPEGHEDIEYRKLVSFYNELISLIPDSKSINLLCINKQIANKVLLLFPNKKIKTIISKMEEIWLRDIMGFKFNSDVYCPIFKPDYFINHYTSEYILSIQKQVEITHELANLTTQHLPIILDGGNFISNGLYGIITEKILNYHSKKKLKKIFNKKLNIEPIIIPHLEGDILGHSDGIINFIDKNTIVLSSYPKHLPSLIQERKTLKIIKTQLLKYGFRIVEIKDRPVFESHITPEGKLPSARGIYVNYIQIDNLIILPEYKLPKYKSTFDYNEFNKKQMQQEGFEVKTINCDNLGKLGGGLRCISWCF